MSWPPLTQRSACRRGHPFPENLKVRDSGSNWCRGCAREVWGSVGFDEIAVERAVHGDPPPYLTPSETREAVRRLDSRGGLTVREIAERTGCSVRTVYRVRAR